MLLPATSIDRQPEKPHARGWRCDRARRRASTRMSLRWQRGSRYCFLQLKRLRFRVRELRVGGNGRADYARTCHDSRSSNDDDLRVLDPFSFSQKRGKRSPLTKVPPAGSRKTGSLRQASSEITPYSLDAPWMRRMRSVASRAASN